MKQQFSYSIVFLFALIFIISGLSTHACTVFIAGKGTTADSSIYFGKTEDDSGHNIDYLWHFPGKEYSDDAFLTGNLEGLEIPQEKTTYRGLKRQFRGR